MEGVWDVIIPHVSLAIAPPFLDCTGSLEVVECIACGTLTVRRFRKLYPGWDFLVMQQFFNFFLVVVVEGLVYSAMPLTQHVLWVGELEGSFGVLSSMDASVRPLNECSHLLGFRL